MQFYFNRRNKETSRASSLGKIREIRKRLPCFMYIFLTAVRIDYYLQSFFFLDVSFYILSSIHKFVSRKISSYLVTLVTNTKCYGLFEFFVKDLFCFNKEDFLQWH